MRAAAALLAFAMAAAAPAAMAQNTPLALFKAGRYDAAIAAGVAQNDADGYATAARSELAKERMRGHPCLACLKRAEAYARKAIAADPSRPQGHVYLAAALGYEARIIGVMQAKFKGYASEAKTNLDAAVAGRPNDPWALAALGGWNIAVVNGGGAMLARMIYGATVKQGLDDFAKAMALDPGSVVIRFQYALALSNYDREAYGKTIEQALQASVDGAPRSAYERFMQGRARALLALFKAGKWEAYDAAVKHDEGYPDP